MAPPRSWIDLSPPTDRQPWLLLKVLKTGRQISVPMSLPDWKALPDGQGISVMQPDHVPGKQTDCCAHHRLPTLSIPVRPFQLTLLLMCKSQDALVELCDRM